MSPSPGCLSNDRSTSVLETGRLTAPRPVLLGVMLRHLVPAKVIAASCTLSHTRLPNKSSHHATTCASTLHHYHHYYQGIHALIASSTSPKNKQTSKRKVQSLLATPHNSKRVQKKFTTSIQSCYFEALATQSRTSQTIEDINKELKISKQIEHYWRQLTSKIGENTALRRFEKSRLERSSKLSDVTLDMLISSTRNLYYNIFLKHQIDQFDLNIYIRMLERNLKLRRNAQHYKKRKIKTISQASKTTRVVYATKHQYKLSYF